MEHGGSSLTVEMPAVKHQMKRASLWVLLSLLCSAILVPFEARAERARSWCITGSLLCRGSDTAWSRYDYQAVLSSEGLVYTLGGRWDNTTQSIALPYYAEEYNLDTSSVQSIWPSNYEDLGVSGRSGHAAFMWTISNGTSYMVVFGGTAYDEEGYMNYLNDVQVLDVAAAIWSTYSHQDDSLNNTVVPSGRQFAGLAPLGGDAFVIFGGQGYDAGGYTTYFNDLWVFNLTTKTWWGPALYEPGAAPPPMLGKATLTSVGNGLLVMYGGWTSNYNALDILVPAGPSNPTSYNVTEETMEYSLSASMWVFDINTAPWAAGIPAGDPAAQLPVHEVLLNPQSGPAGQLMAGFDIQSVMVGSDLIIAAAGAAAPGPLISPNNLNLQGAWFQWFAVYNISNVASVLSTALAAVTAPGDTVSAVFDRLVIWTNAVNPSGLVNVDGTPVDLTTGVVKPWPTKLPNFSKGMAVVMLPESQTILVMGGATESGTEVASVTGKWGLLDWSSKEAVALDSAFKPSDYLSDDGTSSALFKSMIPVNIPQANSLVTHPSLIWIGHYDIYKVDSPDIANIMVADINSASITQTCTSIAPLGSCAALDLTASGRPTPRSFYSAASQALAFDGNYSSGATFTVNVAALLVYGGAYLSGGSANNKLSGAADPSDTLRQALQTCDTAGALSTSLTKSLATCAWSKISSQLQTSGGGPTQSPQRRLLAGLPRDSHRPGGCSLATANPSAAQLSTSRHYGNKNGSMQQQGHAAVSEASNLFPGHPRLALGRTPGSRSGQLHSSSSRSLLTATTSFMFVNQALVGVYQDSASPQVQSRREGPAFLYMPALNLTGGQWHRPGPRLDAASCSLPSGETIMFGGMTYPGSNTVDNYDNLDPNSVVLSNDMYIMKLVVGGEAVVDLAVPSCHSTTPGDCYSLSIETREYAALPDYAPIANSTAKQPSTTTSYCCAPGTQTYQLTVTYSVDKNVASKQGFRILTWDGTTVMTSATSSNNGWMLSGGALAPFNTTVTWKRNITLSDNLYQIVLTSELGGGWITNLDASRSCCNMTAPGGNTTCCPQISLQALGCGGAAVLPARATLWDERANMAAYGPAYFSYEYRYGLRTCSGPSPPTGSAAQYLQYPMEQRGVYLHAYEVMPAASMSAADIPTARNMHAIVYMDDPLIEPTYGVGGILVMFGGTTDPAAQNYNYLLNDLWVFMLCNHTWSQLSPAGTAPAARQGHALSAHRSQLFIAGGEYYDYSAKSWTLDSTIYSLDLSLGSHIEWRSMDGGKGKLLSLGTTPYDTYTNMVYQQEEKKLFVNYPTDLYFVPVTERLDANSLTLSANNTLKSRALATAMTNVYDGDTVILAGVPVLYIESDVQLIIRAGIFIQGSQDANSMLTSGNSPFAFRRRLYYAATHEWKETDSEAVLAISQHDSSVRPRRKLLQLGSSMQSIAESAPEGVMLPAVVQQLKQQYEALWGNGFTVVTCQGLTNTTAMLFLDGTTTLSNLLIINCTDTAIVVSGTADVTITNTIFYNNTGTLGGAVRVDSSTASVSLQNCVFLNNTAVNGSAVYVGSGGWLSGSTLMFQGNGQGSAAQAGGAIYADQACLSYCWYCYFYHNGRTTAAAGSNIQMGGGVYINGTTCTTTLYASVFSSNAATRNGGAVAITNSDSIYDLLISSSTFRYNTAGGPDVDALTASYADGGAVYMRTIYSHVTLTDSYWYNNTARRSGGGIWTSLTAHITGSMLTFLGNNATLSAGGGVFAEKDGSFVLSDARFTSNAAKHGGGLGVRRDLLVTLLDCVFDSNSAELLAGGMEADGSGDLVLTGCNFTANTAPSAGGLALLQLPSAMITGSNFTSNMASINQSAATECSETVAGAGGAVCMDIQGPVTIHSTNFSSNMATMGASLHITQKCIASEDRSCGIAQVGAAGKPLHFTNNTAAGGGGGVAWLYEATDASFMCQDNTTLPSYDTACPEWQLSTDTTSYAAGLTTSSTGLQFTNPVSGKVWDYLSSSVVVSWLNTTVAIMDSFNQTISGGSAEAAAQFLATLDGASYDDLAEGAISPGSLSGSMVMSATRGLVNFYNLRLKAVPGNYTVRIAVSGLLHKVPSVTLWVNVRGCRIGETTNADHDECNPCTADTFSLASNNFTCDSCPTDEAICVYDGKSQDAVPFGSVIVPLDGYWHSSPLSPQMHECINKDACSGGAARTARLVAYQKALASGNSTLNSTQYSDLLCSEGYYGNLCGGCVDGYGRQGSGVCVMCPSRAVNTIYYILASCITVVMIIITIKAQLKTDDEDDEEEDEGWTNNSAFEDDPAAKQQPERHNPSKVPEKPALKSPTPIAESTERPGTPLSPPATCIGPSVSFSPGLSPFKPESSEPSKLLQRRRSTFSAAGSKNADKEEHDDNKISSPPHSIAIKILVNYLQVAAIISNVSLKWPSIVAKFLSAADEVSNGVSTMVSMDCSLSSGRVPKSVQTVIISVAQPFVIFALSIPVWVGLWLKQKKQKASRGEDAWEFKPYFTNRLIITSISIIFYFYTSITQTLLSLFDCPVIDATGPGVAYGFNALAGGTWWSEDYNMQCYKGPHLALVLALGVPGVILFCLGVPIGSALFLWYHKDMLHTKGFLAAFGFIYGDYEDKWYWWDSIISLRKFLIVVVVVFIGNIGNDMQLLVSLGTIIAATVLHMMCLPFRIYRMDVIERMSLWGSTAVIYMALYFVIDSSSPNLKVGMGTLLVLSNSALVIILATQIVKEWMWSAMHKLDKDKDGVLSRADVSGHIIKMTAKKQLYELYKAKLLSTLLEFLGRTTFLRRVAALVIIFPCEQLGAHVPQNVPGKLHLTASGCQQQSFVNNQGQLPVDKHLLPSVFDASENVHGQNSMTIKAYHHLPVGDVGRQNSATDGTQRTSSPHHSGRMYPGTANNRVLPLQSTDRAQDAKHDLHAHDFHDTLPAAAPGEAADDAGPVGVNLRRPAGSTCQLPSISPRSHASLLPQPTAAPAGQTPYASNSMPAETDNASHHGNEA